MTDKQLNELYKIWIIRKNKFSNLSIDQIPEQEISQIRGEGGIIGSNENLFNPQNWMICGPGTLNIQKSRSLPSSEQNQSQFHNRVLCLKQTTEEREIHFLLF